MRRSTTGQADWPFIGQGQLGMHLISAIDTGRLPSTVLFSGPAHLGKAAAVRWLTQRYFCQADDRPCGRCPSCRAIELRQHPWSRFLGSDESARITIDDVRQAVGFLNLTGIGHFQFWFIITDAERLTEGATNALLKFIEEPPTNVQTWLTTSQPERLLPTLVSRSAQYLWHFAPAAEIAKTMKRSTGRGRSLAGAAVDRAAGRPGWLTPRADEEETVRSFLNELMTGAVTRPPDDPIATLAVLDLRELCLRELILLAISVSGRSLWPRLRTLFQPVAETVPLASLLKLYDRYAWRHLAIRQNVQPKFIYEDLALR